MTDEELEALKALSKAWQGDVVGPRASVQEQLAQRIGGAPIVTRRWVEPQWQKVADGIQVKLLSIDDAKQQVSMLVRLAPGTEYPPHTHAGPEELHLLDGELWIDDKKLVPGDFNRAEPGTSDRRVWTETGCTCVLITSTADALG